MTQSSNKQVKIEIRPTNHPIIDKTERDTMEDEPGGLENHYRQIFFFRW